MFEVLLRVLRKTKKEQIAEKIEKILKELDFEPQLKIEKFNAPTLNRWIILADGKSNHPKNPTIYAINTGKSYDNTNTLRQEKTFAVMITALAIRKRSQSGDKKPQPFLHLELNEEFQNLIEKLAFETWDEFSCDAEIISRIAGNMFESGLSMKDIKEILTMDASAIIEKLGMEFIQDSMYI
jgi:hypothetical protein